MRSGFIMENTPERSKDIKKKRKTIFRSAKRNYNRKKQLKSVLQKCTRQKKIWSKDVEAYFKRYLNAAFDKMPALSPNSRPNMKILRLTASRVYKVFDPELVYDNNIQYPHKDICINSEETALKKFLQGTDWSFFRPGTIVNPQYFFMSCIPDALIRNSNEICLVEIKTKIEDKNIIIDGQEGSNIEVLREKWLHQIQFSLHVCALQKAFLVIYDNNQKSILEVQEIFKDEEYFQKHLEDFVNYFVNKIFLEMHPLNGYPLSLRQKGSKKLIRRVWLEIASNEEKLKELSKENSDFFETLYQSFPFKNGNNLI